MTKLLQTSSFEVSCCELRSLTKKIYVIALEENRFFVYYTDTSCEEDIFTEVSCMFEFTQKYKPQQIIESIWTTDMFEIDKYVKKYMLKYGIDRVRGGSYTSLELCDHQRNTIETELSYLSKAVMLSGESIDITFNNKLFCNTKYLPTFEKDIHSEEKMRYFLYTNIHKKPAVLVSESAELILGNQCRKRTEQRSCSTRFPTKLVQQITYYYDQFMKKKELLSKYKFFEKSNNTYTMNKQLSFKIENIKNYLYDVRENGFSVSENLHIRKDYQNVMVYVGHVLKFYDTNDKNNTFSMIYLSCPHFLLDKFFLHKPEFNENELKQAIILWEIIEGMYYCVLNRIDELEFDLKHIPENIEWKHNLLCHYISHVPFNVNGT